MGTAAGRWVLTTAVLGSGLAFIDATVVNVALERIGTDFGADFTGLQWTVNALHAHPRRVHPARGLAR
ncbi:hypothetical protein FHX44_113201 [Pseudonocardia hierapolitana]|uniref:MFS transporter n=1 Tax=Pseudonocardia hierapolitana TaxID=1128676 RepID=A0A561SR24_9PSEU|nr:hypothetical protein [Pseudonocardia hierapolitana]TWF77296.1 hypothetical protein FHX44_113201 [Pseudonocardia hierapolitana]